MTYGRRLKSRWPARRIVDRRQDFRSDHWFPDGFIEETLECGHVHRESLRAPYGHAEKRRCKECFVAARGASHGR